jgi:small-conductance mechanosensitive channel
MRENMRGIWNRLFPLSKAVSIVWTTLAVLLILFPPNRSSMFWELVLGRYMYPIWTRNLVSRSVLSFSLARMIAEGFTITIIAVALIAVFQVLGRQPDDNDG